MSSASRRRIPGFIGATALISALAFSGAVPVAEAAQPAQASSASQAVAKGSIDTAQQRTAPTVGQCFRHGERVPCNNNNFKDQNRNNRHNNESNQQNNQQNQQNNQQNTPQKNPNAGCHITTTKTVDVATGKSQEVTETICLPA
ncbi:hypothetical protein ACFWOJ_28845 [Streptomyces sp. NPDC058439]|uniref:hypothetical protein n=1 Tax=Streptomyces sp. NPDC058439 TaxID=3346500 RepID=UPI0036570CB4